MRRFPGYSALLAMAITLGVTSPAVAWDPDETDETAGVPFEPPPFVLPAAESFAPPTGIYLVTDAYTGDYVSHDGPVTTYGTATVHGPTDSYARVIDSVATGAGSIFDGTAFNGRSALTDGRPVAGTYYENFFLTDAGFVSFGIVFFQDDAETAVPVPVAVPAPVAAPVARPLVPPIAPPAPPISTPGPVGAVVPQVEAPASRPISIPSVPEPLPTARVEVLRGRRVAIWLTRLPADAAWHFTGGEAIVLGPRDGAASDPFVARWDRLAAPGATWTLRFEVTAAGAPARTLAIEVAVRSPGLVE